ncbi:MAG TPA: cysteine desulfuration protein SufE [Alphaproteobacteria bacterium]|nr:cysteine desulfuration protein SufE [Alphaproteobacteria bacterium]
MDLAELVENFSFLEDWEARYSYLIELGNALPPMAEADKNADTKVDGCMSQVWLKTHRDGDVLTFEGESDAHIVRGLIAVLQIILSGKTVQEILATDVAAVFAKLGLDAHLSPTRRNGFFAMVERIKSEAAKP